MKQFMMIFRNEGMDGHDMSPEEMQGIMQQWNNWLGGIAAQDKLIGSEALGKTGKLLKDREVISDGPYAEVKEYISGYAIIKADSFEEAVEVSKGCPIFDGGGTLEVRDVMVFDQ